MIYVCPTCMAEFKNESSIQSHFLKCWKEKHPFHQSKSAQHSADVVTKEVNDDVIDFFNSLKG